jgi:hypothetical protein
MIVVALSYRLLGLEDNGGVGVRRPKRRSNVDFGRPISSHN